MPAAVPNTSAVAQKKNQTAVVPISAPISGRTSKRWIGPRWVSRSSTWGAGTPAAVWVLCSVTTASATLRSPKKIERSGRTSGPPARSKHVDVGQRVPCSTNALTSATFSVSTKPGPVRMG